MNVFDLVAKISLDSSQYEAGLKNAGGKMKAVGTKMSAFGATMTKRVTLPIVALTGASVKAFNDVKNGLNIVIQKTGASGKALADMHQSVKTLATEIPASFEDIGTAVGEVNTRFGITGDELEDLSGQFVKFAKVNGTDVNSSIDTTQKALAAFGLEAEDASGLLDTMTRVGQNTGVSMDTLMNGLVQNGTAFQELGLSIEQSVGLMGQLDKSGANSSTVMQGLRRALKNAAKEGVPLDKALTDLQSSILDGKDGMDGLTTAYELFGRSGDQIYGAVKNGTIDFTKLGGAAEDASGVLDKTFEATLTPAEKFQKTLNSLKVTGYEFGNTALGMLAPAFEKITKKAKELSEKWQNMDDHSKQTIIKFLAIAAAVGPIITIFGKLATGIGAIATVSGKAVGGISSFMSALAAGSTGAVAGSIIAIAALSAALIKWAADSRQAAIEENALDAQERKTVKSLEKATEAYNEVDKARKEATADILSEAQYSHDLVDEYNDLIDSNGKVKSGYEDRADFIKGQLAEALGVEKDKIDDLIGKNGKLKQAVNELIETKKNEALLDANKDAYTKAIQTRQEATEKMGKALREKAKQEADYAKAQQEYQKAEAEYHNSSGKFSAQYQQRMNKAKDAMKSAELGIKEQEKAIKGYQDTLSNANTEIANYEGLAQAIASKDTKAIQEWAANLSAGIKTRKNATQQELNEQAKTIEEEYQLIKQAYDKGEKGITEQMVKDAKKRSDAAKREAGQTEKVYSESQSNISTFLKKMSKDASDKGQKSKANLLKNLATMASGAEKNFSKVSKDASSKMGSAEGAVSKSSKNMKNKFPINVGKMLKGSVSYPKFDFKGFIEKVKGAAKALFPNLSAGISTLFFAKAYDRPYLFTSPTMYNGAVFGDRGVVSGGEVVYGKNKLMSDMTDAVERASSGNIIINLNYNASDDANDMMKDIVRGIQRYRMAGVI